MRSGIVGAVALGFVLWSSSAPADTAAEVNPVTVLVQTNDIVVSPDGSSVQTEHSELHADNDAGAIRLGQVQVGFNMSRQTLEIVEAYTLKPDGTKIPVDTSAVYERLPQDEANDGMVTDQRVKVIIFPQMTAGDTAVFTVKLVNKKPIFPGIFTYGQAFTPSAPVKEVRDTITAPKSLNLQTETHGLEFKSQDNGQTVTYSWRYSALHPGTAASPAVSPMDQMPRYFVSNFKDYAALGRAYDTVAGPKIEVTAKVAALAAKLTDGISDPREQTRRMYEWVTSHIRYIAIELGQGTIVPHNVDDILTYGYGDCKDHDTLMRALLKAKGIDSESVLLNAANAYTLTQVPTFAQLDHVITYVPSLKLYLDSSTATTPFGVLPYSEYGKPAVYVSATGATRATMPVLAPGLSTEHTTNVVKLSATGILTGTTTTTASGPSEILLRLVGLAMQAVSPAKIAQEQLQARGYAGGTGTLSAGPPMVPGRSYSITGTFSVPGWAEWLTGRKVSFMPIGLRILGVTGDGPMGSIASIKSSDMSPVPCFSVHQSEDDSLEIPANTRFIAIPPDADVSTDNIRFTAHWSVAGRVLSVHRDFVSKIDQPLCTGTVRRQTAKALLEIAINYLGQIRIVPDTGAPAVVSQNMIPTIGPKPVGGPDDIAFNNAVPAGRLADASNAGHLVTELLASHADGLDHSFTMHLAQGLAFLQGSQLGDAVAELSEAIRLDPDAGTEPYSARATAYARMGKNRLAVTDIETALKSAPDDLALRQTHADLLVQLHDYDGAAADYNILVRAHPDDLATVLGRAGIRYHADKYEESAADYRHAARLGAPDKDVMPGLCNATARSDEFANALKSCDWTLKQDPQLAAALESRGYTYFQLGKYGEALADIARAAAIAPKNLHYLYERGVLELKLGHAAAGHRDIDAATKADARISHRVPDKMAL